MSHRILIKTGDVTTQGVLNDTSTANAVWEALPPFVQQNLSCGRCRPGGFFDNLSHFQAEVKAPARAPDGRISLNKRGECLY